MGATIIVMIVIFGFMVIFGSFQYYIKFKKNNLIKKYNLDKIDNISKRIFDIINSKQSLPYYNSLNTDITSKINTFKNSKDTNTSLMNIDILYNDLKHDISVLDEYKEFSDKFTYRKRKYRMIFNKSLNILNLLEKKYDNKFVQKYLISFNSDFSNLRLNEINELTKLINISKKSYNSGNIGILRSEIENIKKIDCDIIIKLNEPNRLRDRFISSEDNIDQLENELVNKKGSLYYKVFYNIKNGKVSREDSDEWNIIKRNINNFKKSRLMSGDIIELNNKLNNIIDDLTELNNIIKSKNNSVTTIPKIVN
tara:strand:+ start:105454 stop:106383 length:930 start_codon:yes stop_codon:yes gene_type:complete